MRKSSSTLLLALCLSLGCLTVAPRCIGSDIRAFSLREADRLLGAGSQDGAQDLRQLGGITRFAGMVFDSESADIILVGRANSGLPSVTVDDLMIALQARIRTDSYPAVSIDLTEQTATSGFQQVRYVGAIEGTQFGADFLGSDVALKRYSLDLLESISGITPYLTLYEVDKKRELEREGAEVEAVEWFSGEEGARRLKDHLGRRTSAVHSVQSRFWFNVMEDESFVVEKDGVYVIEELRIGVSVETISHRNTTAVGQREEQGRDEVAEEFAQQFTAHYRDAARAHPELERLKVLFDLVCIAEGIAHLGDRGPTLAALTDRQNVTAMKTDDHFPLLQRVGEFRSSSDSAVLVQVSGGIELEAILLALEDGDVSALKFAVLESRPTPDALSWQVPLDDWQMPNDSSGEAAETSVPTEGGERLEITDLGFGLTVQEAVLDPASRRRRCV